MTVQKIKTNFQQHLLWKITLKRTLFEGFFHSNGMHSLKSVKIISSSKNIKWSSRITYVNIHWNIFGRLKVTGKFPTALFIVKEPKKTLNLIGYFYSPKSATIMRSFRNTNDIRALAVSNFIKISLTVWKLQKIFDNTYITMTITEEFY